MPGSDQLATPVLTARNLVAGYLPGINILNGMSVDVLRGQVRCVLGPNGTGKSTLLKVLFGFLPALAGRDPIWARPRCTASPRTRWRIVASPICRNGQACSRSCRST